MHKNTAVQRNKVPAQENQVGHGKTVLDPGGQIHSPVVFIWHQSAWLSRSNVNISFPCKTFRLIMTGRKHVSPFTPRAESIPGRVRMDKRVPCHHFLENQSTFSGSVKCVYTTLFLNLLKGEGLKITWVAQAFWKSWEEKVTTLR